MSRKSPSFSGLWLCSFLLLCLFLLLGLPTACGTPQLGLQLYQGDVAKAMTLTQIGTVYKPPLELTSSDGTTDLIDLSAPAVKLPKFRCTEWLKRSAEVNEGTALGLLPSMVINGFVDGKLTLAGRFPLDVACRKLKASILMAPVGQLSTWRAREDKRSGTTQAWDRVGHAIVRLPDGRYLISGGAGTLSFDARGLPSVSKLPTDTFLYDPAAGTLEDGPTLAQPRAFHGAVVFGEHVFVLGGLDDKGKIAATEGWRASDLTPLPESDFPSEIKSLNPRAWQRVLKIKASGAAGTTKDRIVQVGGISCPPDMIGSNECKGDQLLHAQVVVMPKRRLVMVIGGVFFVPGFDVWRPLTQLHIYNYDSLVTPFTLEKAATKQDFTPARIGHVALRQSENKVWVFGGLVPIDGNASLSGTNRVNSINVLTLDAESRVSTENLFVVGDDVALGRVLSTGIPLDEGRVLVLGGFLRAPANDNDPGTLAKEALVLQVDPADPSNTTLQVHTLAHTPRLLPLAYQLPTGQHWISGGASLGPGANGPFPASGGIQLYNPRPAITVGELVKFELLRNEPTRDEPGTGDANPGDASTGDGEPASPDKTGEGTTEPPPDTTGADQQNPDATPATSAKWCRRTADFKGLITDAYYQACGANEICVPCPVGVQCDADAGVCQPVCGGAKTCSTGSMCTKNKGVSSEQFCFVECGPGAAKWSYESKCPLGTVCEAVGQNSAVYPEHTLNHCRASPHYHGWSTGTRLLGQACAKTDGCDGSKGFFCRQQQRVCAQACDPRANSTQTCPAGQTCKVDIESFFQGRCE